MVYMMYISHTSGSEPVLVDTMIVQCADCRSYVDATVNGRFERLSDGSGPFFPLLTSVMLSVRHADIGADDFIWQSG
jgi:hypothetical protein